MRHSALQGAQSKCREHIYEAFFFDKIFIICSKGSREKGSFKTLPIDGARACRPTYETTGSGKRRVGKLWSMELGSHFPKTRLCLIKVLQYMLVP